MFIGDRRQTADSMILGVGGQQPTAKFEKFMNLFSEVFICSYDDDGFRMFSLFHPQHVF